MAKTYHTPGCHGKEHDWFQVSDRNRHIGSQEFRYLHCDHCGLVRLDNVPSNLGDYYPADYYALPTAGQLAKIADAAPFKIDVVKRFAKQGRLLEIGPAYGVFAFQAKQAGFQVDAIEMDARCCDYLTKVVGINAVHSDSPHEAISALGTHDVIALWHVIEHVPDPWTLLAAIANNLAPNGILILAAPNPDAWQFHVMGKQWPHVDAPRHLYLLPAQALIDYAKSLGLEQVHYTTTDSDARKWNRFGWQKLLMNLTDRKLLQYAGYLAGYIVSIVLAPFETRAHKGSAYTLVLRKVDSGTKQA